MKYMRMLVLFHDKKTTIQCGPTLRAALSWICTKKETPLGVSLP